jgi:hypothetical protein
MGSFTDWNGEIWVILDKWAKMGESGFTTFPSDITGEWGIKPSIFYWVDNT